MTDTTKILPKLRFPEFKNDGKWKAVKLGEIAHFFKGKGISKAEVSNTGTIPCIRYGELYTYYKEVVREFKSYTNIPTDNLVLSKANDVIIPSSGETKEDISTASCIIEDGIALGGDINIIRSSANGIFLSYYLNNAKKNDIAKIAQGISIIHLYNEQLQNLSIALPTLPEQQKIASFLISLDEQISAHTKKLEALKAHKKGLMQQLFPANGEKTPKLRFPEFKNDGEWEEVRLGDIVNVYQGYGFPEALQGKKHGRYPFYKVSDISNTVNQGLYKIDAATNYLDEDDLPLLNSTKLIPQGTIIFAKIGEAIRLNRRVITTKESLIDNNTAGVKAKKGNIDDMFLFYTMIMIDLMKFAGGVVPAVKKSIIENIQIIIPSLPEQQKIASFLSSIDEMIQTQDDKIQKLKIYKNGLMQQMFPNEK